MTNRLKQLMEEPDERPPDDDYYEVVTGDGTYYVAQPTAAELERALARRWPPRWLRFTDMFGAAVTVLTRTVTAVCQSTSAQRDIERAFRRRRRREEKDDWRPWEDEWW
jgi:hypothetical protein